MLPAASDAAPVDLEPAYTFLTECFFMTHYCLNLGYRMLHERLVKLNQDLHRIQQVYQDMIQQAGTGGSEQTQRIKEDMERGNM